VARRTFGSSDGRRVAGNAWDRGGAREDCVWLTFESKGMNRLDLIYFWVNQLDHWAFF
jgi:hypothetical protein